MRWKGRIFGFICLGLALNFVHTAAYAQLSVDKVIVEFSNDDPVQYVILSNSGEEAMYIVTELNEVIDPHLEQSTLKSLEDPRISPMLASPRTLMIPPGKRKRIRMILKEKIVDADRVFKFSIKQYHGGAILNAGQKDKVSSGVKVALGYKLLLLARPDKPEVAVEVKRSTDEIEFYNRGNTNVLLRTIEQCDRSKDACTELAPNRLYVGEKHTIKLPMPGSAEKYPVKTVQIAGHDSYRVDY